MAHDPIYHSLVESLQKPGCAICRVTKYKVHGYLDALLYENVNDSGTRVMLRGAHGFCHRHAWEAATLRDALGLAILYRDVITAVGKDLTHARDRVPNAARSLLRQEPAPPGQATVRRLTARRPCPACTVEADVADTSLTMLVQRLNDIEMGQAFAASQGLCLPHLRRALALAQDSKVVEELLGKQAQVLEGLAGELSEFIRKHDYRFTKEGFGAERDAYMRAIAILVGAADGDAPEVGFPTPDQAIPAQTSEE